METTRNSNLANESINFYLNFVASGGIEPPDAFTVKV